MLTMELKWTNKALSDLERLYEFLALVNKKSAAQTIQSLVKVPMRLITHPRLGEKLEEFGTREVRRLLIGLYGMRYEIQQSTLYVLRLWHTQEER